MSGGPYNEGPPEIEQAGARSEHLATGTGYRLATTRREEAQARSQRIVSRRGHIRRGDLPPPGTPSFCRRTSV